MFHTRASNSRLSYLCIHLTYWRTSHVPYRCIQLTSFLSMHPTHVLEHVSCSILVHPTHVFPIYASHSCTAAHLMFHIGASNSRLSYLCIPITYCSTSHVPYWCIQLTSLHLSYLCIRLTYWSTSHVPYSRSLHAIITPFECNEHNNYELQNPDSSFCCVSGNQKFITVYKCLKPVRKKNSPSHNYIITPCGFHTQSNNKYLSLSNVSPPPSPNSSRIPEKHLWAFPGMPHFWHVRRNTGKKASKKQKYKRI